MGKKKATREKLSVCRRIGRALLRRYAALSRTFTIMENEQATNFEQCGLDRKEGLRRLNLATEQVIGHEYSESHGMFSEHLVLLAALAAPQYSIRKILEIGTYDGLTAAILNVLYPNATILTIDLPQDEVSFTTTYERGDAVSSFVQRRNENLNRSNNISFKEMNSVTLALSNDEFDLIWVDGAHGYPVVAMDVINSVRLLKPSGFLLIDDVWTERAHSDSIYRSIAACESLEAMRDAKVIDDFTLIPKRLGSVFNMPGEKKYVGVVQKRSVRHS